MLRLNPGVGADDDYFMLPSRRFSDTAATLIDSLPDGSGPHLKFLHDIADEMTPFDFYRELFPAGELDEESEGWEYNTGRYSAIAVRIFNDGGVKRYKVGDELRVINKLTCCNEFCVLAPISWAGKSRKQEYARKLYAVVFDLDGLLETEDGQSKSLINLFSHIELGIIPEPSHIVFSGTGVHLYYMLEQPLPLFPNVMQSLSAYRRCLTEKIWNYYITSLWENPQYESVTQDFRMVGTTAKYGRTVRAFKTGPKVSVKYLNQFVDDDSKIADVKYVSKTPMSVAKKSWPDWYQRRIVEGQPRGTWTVNRDLYDWWKRKIEEGATVGHRYFCIMALAIYARKCGVPYEELEEDAYALIPFLNGLDGSGEKPFTTRDVGNALEAYNADYITFPRYQIERLTGISIPANKRNGRTREAHMRRVNAMIDYDISMGEKDVRYHGGRPKGSGTKEAEIKAYAAAHPEANHSEIARALGISRPTVIKWLKNYNTNL